MYHHNSISGRGGGGFLYVPQTFCPLCIFGGRGDGEELTAYI
jgi:hypothetical protein